MHRSAVPAAGCGGCGRICSREMVGAAQCVGQPVPAGHAPDQAGRVGCGHPGRGDEQRAHRGSARDRDRVGSRAEPGLGDPDHRDAELGVRMRAQAGPAAGVQIGVAIDDQQAQPAQIGQDRAQRRELAQVELTRPVGRYPGLPSRCVRPARARRLHRRPARLPPGHRRCSGNARPRLRTHRRQGARRFPCLEDARTCASIRSCPGRAPHRSDASGPAGLEA